MKLLNVVRGIAVASLLGCSAIGAPGGSSPDPLVDPFGADSDVIPEKIFAVSTGNYQVTEHTKISNSCSIDTGITVGTEVNIDPATDDMIQLHYATLAVDVARKYNLLAASAVQDEETQGCTIHIQHTWHGAITADSQIAMRLNIDVSTDSTLACDLVESGGSVACAIEEELALALPAAP